MMPKKASKSVVNKGKVTDEHSAMDKIAEQIGSLAESTYPLHHVSEIADSLAHVAAALDGIYHARALRIIADHGSDDERIAVVKHLKRGFDGVFDE